MKPYVAYSTSAGKDEGAILIIAHTVREAKNLAWPHLCSWNVDEWTDMAVRWLRDNSLLALADQDKLARDVAHAVAEPVTCQSCNLWGYGVDANGACCYCGEAAGETLVNLLRKENKHAASNQDRRNRLAR